MTARVLFLACLALKPCPVQDGDDNETNGTTETDSADSDSADSDSASESDSTETDATESGSTGSTSGAAPVHE